MVPCTQLRYGSSSDAHLALAALGGADVRTRHRLQPCGDCQGWHVTVRPRRASAPRLRGRLRVRPARSLRTG
jgi:hypothetical protein